MILTLLTHATAFLFGLIIGGLCVLAYQEIKSEAEFVKRWNQEH